jgi:hypothetical protein
VTCRCCGGGIKASRGFTWIDPKLLFNGDHDEGGRLDCACPESCPACWPDLHFSFNLAGLLWIGEGFYKSPGDFLAEGAQQGISRRISQLPREFQVGETWVFMGHRKTVPASDGFLPGIFLAIRPQRVERIVKQSEYDHWLAVVREKWRLNGIWSELIPPEDKVFWKIQRDMDRNITPVPVPDMDEDHKGKEGDTDEG